MTTNDSKESTLTARFMAPLIARAMGNGWRLKPCDEPHDDNATLTNGDGAEVGMRTNQYGHKGRIVCMGYGPRSKRGLHMERGGTGEITVSVERGAAVIAREIVRRLLPVYLPARAAVLAREAQADACEHSAQSVAIDLAKRAGTRKPWQRSERDTEWCLNVPNGSAKVNAYDSNKVRVRMELSGLTPECAAAICDALCAFGEAD